jgi:glyoxylase-like metal-dependent hydrolase (beta-lactamase superfamily II)
VLFEAGIGAFFEPRLRDRYGVQEDHHVLISSLREVGVAPEAIDVIVISHLHFDHAGGLLTPWTEGKEPELAFSNAHYIVGKDAWARAVDPHPRDRASFIAELQPLLETTGRLEIVGTASSPTLGDAYSFTFSSGHTPGLMLTRIEGPCGPITFVGDLAPGVPWVHLPITMGYDRYPELLVDEKSDTFARIESEHGWVFFTHDPEVSAARIERDAKGRYRAIDTIQKLRW